MEAYYPYPYANGAVGVTYDAATKSYDSAYSDAVYGAMAYCPIADIENADLAYAWMRFDSTLDENGILEATAGNYSFSAFQLALQKDAAYAFAQYINSLGLTDADGMALAFAKKDDGTLDLRAGTYYEAVLRNISNALNTYLVQMDDVPAYLTQTYPAWI